MPRESISKSIETSRECLTETGLQVECNPSCVVDATSSTNQSSELVDIFTELETYRDVSLINLEAVEIDPDKEMDQFIKDKFVCSICHGLLVRSRVLLCGHNVCRECLFFWFKSRRFCPICRKEGLTNVPSLCIDGFLDAIVDRCADDGLKSQRVCRKTEQQSACLDNQNNTRLPMLLATTMVSSHSQTIRSQGLTAEVCIQTE